MAHFCALLSIYFKVCRLITETVSDHIRKTDRVRELAGKSLVNDILLKIVKKIILSDQPIYIAKDRPYRPSPASVTALVLVYLTF